MPLGLQRSQNISHTLRNGVEISAKNDLPSNLNYVFLSNHLYDYWAFLNLFFS